jgi:pantothenate kinase type III
MNLIIDIGNSSVKLAVFEGNSMLDFNRTHIGDLDRSVKKNIDVLSKSQTNYIGLCHRI